MEKISILKWQRTACCKTRLAGQSGARRKGPSTDSSLRHGGSEAPGGVSLRQTQEALGGSEG